jgi:hypothetical protein
MEGVFTTVPEYYLAQSTGIPSVSLRMEWADLATESFLPVPEFKLPKVRIEYLHSMLMGFLFNPPLG